MTQKESWLILDYAMDPRILAISICTGLLFGLAPALRLSSLDVNATLKDGGRGATGSGTKHLSALLVTGEMALAVVLLAGAGVMIRSFLKIHNASIGVNQILKSELVAVSPADPLTFLVAAGALILAATLGCWIPARRAMRVDPVVALRHE